GRIRQAFASRPVYIADGHHRYETAIHYRDACRQAVRDRGEVPDPDAGYEFAMVLFVDSRDPGLVIRPYHRVIGATGKDLSSVLGHLEDMCNILSLSVSGNGDAKDLGAIEQALGDATSTDDHPCVLYTRQGAWKVSPRGDVAWKETLPGGHSDAWQGLDVVSVDWLIVQGGFGIEASHEEAGHPGEVPRLRYSPDASEAIGLVARGEAEVAILVRPTERLCHARPAGTHPDNGSLSRIDDVHQRCRPDATRTPDGCARSVADQSPAPTDGSHPLRQQGPHQPRTTRRRLPSQHRHPRRDTPATADWYSSRWLPAMQVGHALDPPGCVREGARCSGPSHAAGTPR
ncbi:MAG: DUF1015 family protein, partial [Proteobacteria bacterium]|nr:DUF1015 family protein [Pseudomonadota bacterium]